LYQLPWGVSTSLSYAYGSGTRYNDSIAVAVYGKPGTNRVNLTANGAASPTITIPAAVVDRWLGAQTIASGEVIPRNALEGTPYSRFDLRLTKEFKVGGSLRASVIGEIYNLFNHANFTSFSTTLSPTNAATTQRFGQPTGADIPRQGQLAFRIAF
jgi:hypothetical protein